MTLTLIALFIGAPVLWTVARLVGALASMGVLCVVIVACRALSTALGALLHCLPQVKAAGQR